jgi:hypothetical protein
MYLARGRVRSTILFPLHEIVSANAARHTCGIAGLEAAKKLPPACCTEAYSTSATERLARMRTPLVLLAHDIGRIAHRTIRPMPSRLS